jgi:hypothetical protein
MEALITKADIIAAKTHVSTNIDQQSFDAAILDAQRLDFRPIIGNAFYLDILNNAFLSPVPTAYSDLLDGTDYTNTNGDTIRYFGAKIMIINFAFARLMENMNNFYTRAGAKYKISNSSETIKTSDLQSWINTARSQAIAYQEDMLEFLCENEDTYSIWKDQKETKTPRKGSILLRTSKRFSRY